MAMSAGLFLGSIGAGAFMELLGLSYAFYAVSVLLVCATTGAAVMISKPSAHHPRFSFPDGHKLACGVHVSEKGGGNCERDEY